MTSFNSEMTSDGAVNLNIRSFAEGLKMKAKALVIHVRSGIDVNESGFYTFVLKDINANTISARLFHVENFIENGFVAKSFENKPVLIEFIPQIFNGAWSLILKDIKLYDGAFDYESYKGKINVDTSFIDNCYLEVFSKSNPMDPAYYTASFSSICGGRVGGFMKLISSVARDLYNYVDYCGYTTTDLFTVYFYTVEAYYKLLKKKELFEIVDQAELFSILQSITNKISGSGLTNEIVDSCRTILGFGAPQHILSHLIYESIQKELYTFSLIEKNLTLAKGATYKISEGKTLLRY